MLQRCSLHTRDMTSFVKVEIFLWQIPASSLLRADALY